MFLILANFIIEQLTAKCLREVRDISRDVVFAMKESRSCQNFAMDVKRRKAHLKQNLVSGVNLIPPSYFSRQKPHESFV